MNKTLQTKRNKPASGKYRVLYAKTGRKRRYNAATATMDPPAEVESDVPNVGIGRALLVILVLHIVAIGVIYAHSKLTSEETQSVAQPSNPTSPAVAPVAPAAKAPVPTPQPPAPRANPRVAAAAVAPAAADNDPVARNSTGRRHFVMTGETYSSIAQKCHVDERNLRALNDGRALRAGVVLDLPARLSGRPVAVATAAPVERPRETPRPAAQAEHPRAVVVDESPEPVVVKPRTQHPAPAVAQPATAGLTDSGKRHVVSKGDSIWRLAKRFNVSRESLMKINGIDDARKLKLGSKIKIPTK